MDDQGCPRCKTTKYRNPSLKLMVNVCGHTLCENCVEMLFVRGSGNCVQCDTPLRKSNFRVQLFEDASVDKEVEIRKKVMKIYNKREFDFPSLRDYNDYLEQVEDIGRNRKASEQSKLPATILLAQHKVRAAQLETQIEQQKQNVKPTSLFSTGIQIVTAAVSHSGKQLTDGESFHLGAAFSATLDERSPVPAPPGAHGPSAHRQHSS
ncbi:hypothetical protein CCH79_00004406 [Gambusia affinis]|uniref:CDK-activating kinase assembly factor MAT1 n=1 Tax=Gambusia affinis TaxID=33528 RepID=A0A315VCF0_GAMAF|nr:hypothetical protein CCH79_00004406 [Gambusia affinis]